MSDFQITPTPSCADNTQPGLLKVEEARQRIFDALPRAIGHQWLPLRDALGRVLAKDQISPHNVPGHDNSAMDGYALQGDDLPEQGFADLEVIATLPAGGHFEGHCQRGQCVRIMTGAPMPAGTDTVIMQEQVMVLEDGRIRIGTGHQRGQNVRRAGEDIAVGSAVLRAGRRLTPADLGILASLGLAEIPVRRQVRVAFFSTGDELRSLGQPLGEGELYDSNRYSLWGMLRHAGVECHDLGVVPDHPDALRATFEQAASLADVVITSGGVSVGEADYTKPILESLGKMNFWKIAMKPGRPLAFGRLGNALFFGLPGNPVAVMVTFYQFVLPALHRLAGNHQWQPLLLSARLCENLSKKPGRYEFARGIFQPQKDGGFEVRTTGRQGSGILTSMSRANCFILLDETQGSLTAGDTVTIQPFAALING